MPLIKAGTRRPAPWRDHWRSWYQLEVWRRRRRQQLKHEPLCAICLQRGQVRPATIADHIKHHNANWNEFLVGALQSLCEACHNSDKRMAAKGKPKVTIGLDGWPINTTHQINTVP
jgi:5-methylcytosine-specific restriction protein A